jgi:hypothetical protein
MSRPRLELWNGLICASGQRLDTGGFAFPDILTITNAEDGGSPNLKFRLPAVAKNRDAIDAIAEGQIVRVWRSDSDFEEWPINGLNRVKGRGGYVEALCRPLLYRLATCGIVTEYQTAPLDGLPQVDVGVASNTLSEIIQTYIIDHPEISAALGFPLELGTIDPDQEIALDWSWAPPLQVIRSGIQKVQSPKQLYELKPLRRVSTTHYAIDILEVAA